MTGQDLKNSILQLAIQGKLVEQREEEVTAKDLIEEIKAEKERLVKEKKIKKEKPLPEISEEEIPFDIPESWEWVRVIEISDMYTGNSIPIRVKEEKYTNLEAGYEYIATKDVGFDFTIDYDNGVKIPFDEEKFRKSYKDSILMCIEGGSAGRKIGILDRTVCFGNKLCSFNSIGIEPLYLYYYLQSPIFFQEFNNMLTGIIGGVGINKLKTTIVPLPPLEEQKRIVEKIEELMPYIEKYGETHIKLEELNRNFPEDMQKSILQYAIQGKLVEQREEEGFAEELYNEIQKEKEKLIKEGKIRRTKDLAEIKEEEIPFDIPETWKWVRLGSLLTKLTDGAHRTPKYTEIGIPFLSVKDISSGNIDFSDTRFISKEEHTNLFNRCNPQKEDILLTKVGTTGIPVIVDTDREFSLFVSVALLKFNTNLIFNKFLTYAIKSPLVQIQAQKNTKGVGNKNWVMRDIADTILPLPPLEEQKRIVEKIEELLPLCKELKQ